MISIPADFTTSFQSRLDEFGGTLGNRDIRLELWYGRNLPNPYPDIGPGSPMVIDGWEATLYANIITQGDTLPYSVLLRTNDLDIDHLRLQAQASCRTESHRQTTIGIIRTIRFAVRKHE
jgi:hypothetical protein